MPQEDVVRRKATANNGTVRVRADADPPPSSPSSSCNTKVHPNTPRRSAFLTTKRYHLVPLVRYGDVAAAGCLHGSDVPHASSSFYGDVIPIVLHDGKGDDGENDGPIPSSQAAAGARGRAGATTDGEKVHQSAKRVVSFSEPLGRVDVVSSLVSSCRDPSCRGESSSSGRRNSPRSSRPDASSAAAEGEGGMGRRGSKKKRRRSSSRRRWCDNCSDVIVAQRFLSKTMLRFSLSSSTPTSAVDHRGEDAEEEEDAVLRLQVTGPNASMVHLNGVPVVAAMEDSAGLPPRNDDAAPPTTTADQKSTIWRDGGRVRVGDVLSFVNLDAAASSSREWVEREEAAASAHGPKGGDECRNDHNRRDRNRDWSPLRFVIASTAATASVARGDTPGGEPDTASAVRSSAPARSCTDVARFDIPNRAEPTGGGGTSGREYDASSASRNLPPAGTSTTVAPFDNPNVGPPGGGYGAGDGDPPQCHPPPPTTTIDGAPADGDSASPPPSGGRPTPPRPQCGVGRDGGDDVGAGAGNGAGDEGDGGPEDGVVEVEVDITEDSSPMLTMPRFSHMSEAAAEHLFTATATATATATTTATCTYGGSPPPPGFRDGPPEAAEEDDVVPIASLGVDEIRRLRDDCSSNRPSSFRHALLSIALMREDRLAARRVRQQRGGGSSAGGGSPSSSRPPLRLPTLLRDAVVQRSDVYPT